MRDAPLVLATVAASLQFVLNFVATMTEEKNKLWFFWRAQLTFSALITTLMVSFWLSRNS